MDYWISSKSVQMGPYSWEQLQLMWREGKFTSDTFYYDKLRGEWQLLQGLIETKRQLFTVEEAFVRLGQNHQNGCLMVFNKDEYLHLFIENSFVVHAIGKEAQGELALAHAMSLENASYEWFHDAKPPGSNLHINIHDYAVKRGMAPDMHVSSLSKRKSNTMAISKISANKIDIKPKVQFVLVPEEAPTMKLRLVKATNIVGREEHCDLVIEDSQISRKHCLLETMDHNVKVKDLESCNGTFVNGVPITDGYLQPGDQLSLGGYLLTLQKELKRAPELSG